MLDPIPGSGACSVCAPVGSTSEQQWLGSSRLLLCERKVAPERNETILDGVVGRQRLERWMSHIVKLIDRPLYV